MIKLELIAAGSPTASALWTGSKHQAILRFPIFPRQIPNHDRAQVDVGIGAPAKVSRTLFVYHTMDQMTSAAPQPRLRLVGGGESALHSPAVALRAEELAVVKENRIAAHAPGISPGFESAVDVHDPRWILAMQTQARLQGAMLTPERREQLMKTGKKLGLRPFEANLVIAIVQDRARSGHDAQRATPMLSLVRCPADESPAEAAAWPKWFAAVAAAAAVAAVLIRWIAG